MNGMNRFPPSGRRVDHSTKIRQFLHCRKGATGDRLNLRSRPPASSRTIAQNKHARAGSVSIRARAVSPPPCLGCNINKRPCLDALSIKPVQAFAPAALPPSSATGTNSPAGGQTPFPVRRVLRRAWSVGWGSAYWFSALTGIETAGGFYSQLVPEKDRANRTRPVCSAARSSFMAFRILLSRRARLILFRPVPLLRHDLALLIASTKWNFRENHLFSGSCTCTIAGATIQKKGVFVHFGDARINAL